MVDPVMAQGIQDMLDELAPRALLLVGDPRDLAPLIHADDRGVRLVTVAVDHCRRRLRRTLGRHDRARLVCAASSHLPFGRRCFDVVVALRLLARMADPATALTDWCRVLRPTGHLVLADRLSSSPTLRALTRTRHGPEDLTCWLLNAGFADIRQSWTHSHGVVITSGQLREL